MRLTREADYAIRALLDLALNESDGLVRVADVSERRKIPRMYLNKIIQSLSHNGLVRTARGAGGGVGLAMAPSEITVLQIIEAIEGPVYLNNCVSGPGECELGSTCPARLLWADIQATVTQKLASTSLASLVETMRSLEASSAEASSAGSDGDLTVELLTLQ